MKILRVLKNNNKISSEVVRQAYHPAEISDFSIRTVFSGSESYHLGSRKLNVYPGSFIVINNGTICSSKIDSSEPVNNFSISFAQAFLNDFQRTQRNSCKKLLDDPSSTDSSTLQTYMETIYPFSGDMKYNIMNLRQQVEQESAGDLLINEYLHHCLLNYNKIYNTEVVDKSEKLRFLHKSTRTEILKRLTLAKDYIMSNYNKPIQLEAIAAASCLSVNHLLRTFKQAYGKSPHQFLIQVRIDRSKYLLKNTSYTVNEIVDIIGFECPSSFIRLFRSIHQCTPGKYRMVQ